MEPDSYYGQAEAGMRYRRYSDFEYNPKTRELKQLEHRAYVQSKENNAYVGGVVRHFQDFSEEVISSPVMRSLIDTDFEVYKSVLPEELHDEIWQCQIHQIRIEIKPGKQLEITPEGIHCDGYPFSGVHFWGAIMSRALRVVCMTFISSSWRRPPTRKFSIPPISLIATCAIT